MAKIFIFFLPFLVLCFASSSFNNNEKDFFSLLAIKSGVEDPLGSLNSWNQTTHLCSWTGIICGRRHPNRVVGISLRSRGLVGTLSPHVGNLSFLRIIYLRNSTFRGPIPQEISFLRRLEFIDFSRNSFTGEITKNLSTNLVYLDLINNKLSGTIPKDLGSMFKLEALGLSLNKLLGPNFLSSIGNLTSLKKLYLANCGLKGEIPDPASLAQLQRLEFLQLGQNSLTGSVPSALFNLSKLQLFQAFSNQLDGVLPPTLGLTLPNLVAFSLPENQFHGPIPASLSNASLLQELVLSTNYFTGKIPTALRRLTYLSHVVLSSNRIEGNINLISTFINSTNLEVLQVDGNLLTGSLPNSIANLSTQLGWLTLSWNKIHGKIPSDIGNLIGLTILDFSTNHLEGPIPNSIGKLSNLHEFTVSQNRYTDELPSSIGNLSSLIYLLLSENKFSGNLPFSIGNCTNLLELDISNNSFSGRIPPDILSISSLSISFNLSNNLFEGSLPNEVGSLRNLGELNLSYNRLSGPVPNSLSGCSSLQVLDMTGNVFEGEIPSALSALTGLQKLCLSQNNLSGPIPAFLGKLDLQFLNLSFNKLNGEVPTIGIFKNKIAVSLDGNKELCGGIAELNLTPCPRAHTQKKSPSSLLKVLIPIFAAIGLFVTIFAIVIYRQRIVKKNMTSSQSVFTGV